MSREERKSCRCPYCDGPVPGEYQVCQPCSVTVVRCPACGQPLPKDAATCPTCSGKCQASTKEE